MVLNPDKLKDQNSRYTNMSLYIKIYLEIFVQKIPRVHKTTKGKLCHYNLFLGDQVKEKAIIYSISFQRKRSFSGETIFVRCAGAVYNANAKRTDRNQR